MSATRKLSFALLLFLLPAIAHSKIILPSIFTDNMVLQQQSNVAIWGWAKAGASVKVTTSWNKKIYTGTTSGEGKWKIKVSTPVYGGPYTITISDGAAVVLKNILIGEVWVCSGQSNMEMPLKGNVSQPVVGSADAILRSANNQIRLYTVPRWGTTTPRDNSKPASWLVASPETTPKFSAAGYFFGKLLNDVMKVPVGLINDSYGASLAEVWMSAEALGAFPEIKLPAKTDSVTNPPKTPTSLYNGMLHPIIGYGIRGAIWYQGEGNRPDPDQYERLFPAMVRQWRSEWNIGDFPFYFAQIAPFDYADKRGGKFNSAFVRDAQRKAETIIPNSGMAVLLDVGEEKLIHPARKREVGERLAYQALALTYGVKGFDFHSPAYESVAFADGKAVLQFKYADNGFIPIAKGSALFEIAGSDHKFYPAKAAIAGNKITVSAPEVKEPAAVRYAFRDYLVGDLFGTNGLPVSSFRTDDWKE